MADIQKLAHVGDSIECDVRYPHPETIRMRLDTPMAVAHANGLLRDKSSGWRLVNPIGVKVDGGNHA